VITPDIYVPRVEGADEDPASGSLYANLPNSGCRDRTAECSLMSMPKSKPDNKIIVHTL